MYFDSNTPIYLQIINLIKKDIATGKLKNGEKLPSVREVSEQLKVNPNTVQRAFSELENQNITYVQRGKGMYVIDDVKVTYEIKQSMANEIVSNFIQQMEGLGFNSRQLIDIIEDYFNENKGGYKSAK